MAKFSKVFSPAFIGTTIRQGTKKTKRKPPISQADVRTFRDVGASAFGLSSPTAMAFGISAKPMKKKKAKPRFVIG